jgi:hypothetical protein
MTLTLFVAREDDGWDATIGASYDLNLIITVQSHSSMSYRAHGARSHSVSVLSSNAHERFGMAIAIQNFIASVNPHSASKKIGQSDRQK